MSSKTFSVGVSSASPSSASCTSTIFPFSSRIMRPYPFARVSVLGFGAFCDDEPFDEVDASAGVSRPSEAAQVRSTPPEGVGLRVATRPNAS